MTLHYRECSDTFPRMVFTFLNVLHALKWPMLFRVYCRFQNARHVPEHTTRYEMVYTFQTALRDPNEVVQKVYTFQTLRCILERLEHPGMVHKFQNIQQVIKQSIRSTSDLYFPECNTTSTIVMKVWNALISPSTSLLVFFFRVHNIPEFVLCYFLFILMNLFFPTARCYV